MLVMVRLLAAMGNHLTQVHMVAFFIAAGYHPLLAASAVGSDEPNGGRASATALQLTRHPHPEYDRAVSPAVEAAVTDKEHANASSLHQPFPSASTYPLSPDSGAVFGKTSTPDAPVTACSPLDR
jgi:hypothetical protein